MYKDSDSALVSNCCGQTFYDSGFNEYADISGKGFWLKTVSNIKL